MFSNEKVRNKHQLAIWRLWSRSHTCHKPQSHAYAPNSLVYTANVTKFAPNLSSFAMGKICEMKLCTANSNLLVAKHSASSRLAVSCSWGMRLSKSLKSFSIKCDKNEKTELEVIEHTRASRCTRPRNNKEISGFPWVLEGDCATLSNGKSDVAWSCSQQNNKFQIENNKFADCFAMTKAVTLNNLWRQGLSSRLRLYSTAKASTK